MKITIRNEEITSLIGPITWSGNRTQVARVFSFEYYQDIRDINLPVFVANLGETVMAYDDEGNLFFQGNIFSIDKDVQASKVSIKAYDNLFVLCKSKTTRKFTNMTAEDITRAVCTEMGIKVGNLAKTDKQLTFISADKTGYQIIMQAYTQASKHIGKKYHPYMRGDSLEIVEKGTLIEDYQARDMENIKNSTFKESIENMVNTIKVTDEQGNLKEYKTNDEWVKKYSMIQNIYKSSPKANAQQDIQAMLKGPERSATLDMLGDFRAIAGYSLKIKDVLTEITGQFYIKSDSHTFSNGIHEMRLEIEFENIMNEEKAEEENK